MNQATLLKGCIQSSKAFQANEHLSSKLRLRLQDRVQLSTEELRLLQKVALSIEPQNDISGKGMG